MTTELFNQGYALLIGVGNCKLEQLSLPVTVKDTQAIYTALTDAELCAYPPDNIRVLNDDKATKENILKELSWLKEKADNDSEATIFIYYSGHGGVEEDGSYHLIPHDYNPFANPPLKTAVSAAELTEALRKINAQRLLVVIDSCHAAGMATSKDPKKAETEAEINNILSRLKRVAPSKGLSDSLKQGQGRAVFTSAEGEQKSYILSNNSLSIYTYHFLEALQGAGNNPGDTEVKLSNLMGYLDKTVEQTTQQEYDKKQTPYFDLGGNNFAVAKVLGGKGLPEKGWEEVKAEAREKIEQITVGRDYQKVDASGNNNKQIFTQSGNITIKE